MLLHNPSSSCNPVFSLIAFPPTFCITVLCCHRWTSVWLMCVCVCVCVCTLVWFTRPDLVSYTYHYYCYSLLILTKVVYIQKVLNCCSFEHAKKEPLVHVQSYQWIFDIPESNNNKQTNKQPKSNKQKTKKENTHTHTAVDAWYQLRVTVLWLREGAVLHIAY